MYGIGQLMSKPKINSIITSPARKPLLLQVELHSYCSLSFNKFFVLQANAEKDRLEEKQRNIRHERVAQGLPACTARWFEQIAARNAEELPRWRYRGGYWEARESGKWASVPDIYGENQSETQPTSFSHKAAVMLT